jgi:hypothetical protein
VEDESEEGSEAVSWVCAIHDGPELIMIDIILVFDTGSRIFY